MTETETETGTETADDAAHDRAEYWMRSWLDPQAGSLDAWRIEGPDRPRAADQAEIAIRRPPSWPTLGTVRAEVLMRRQVARRWLDAADRELAAQLRRRRLLVERIEACTLALVGTRGVGRRCPQLCSQDAEVLAGTADTGAPADLPDAADAGQLLSGRTLRRAAVDLVLGVGTSIELPEILRLLALQGMTAAGRPSQTLSNALRPAVASGEIVRLGSGRYAPPPARSDRSR